MDRLTLIEKNIVFMTRFAAPSVLTGNFVARIIDSDAETISAAFTDPGPMLVHNMDGLYADKTYTGYTGIQDMRFDTDGITVVLDKEVHNDAEGIA